MPLEIHNSISLFLSYLERGSDSGAAYEERVLSTIRTPLCCWVQVFTSAALLDLEPGGRHPHRMCVEPRGAIVWYWKLSASSTRP